MDVILALRIGTLAFLSILFMQSGFDKVFNYQGNLSWLKEHFEKSPLKGFVPLLMVSITIMEVAAGVCSFAGIIMLLLKDSLFIGLIGSQLSMIAILALFFGQRLAQDYEGAATLTTYFIISIISIYFFS